MSALHVLHLLLIRRCWQMLAPPHSLHVLLCRALVFVRRRPLTAALPAKPISCTPAARATQRPEPSPSLPPPLQSIPLLPLQASAEPLSARPLPLPPPPPPSTPAPVLVASPSPPESRPASASAGSLPLPLLPLPAPVRPPCTSPTTTFAATKVPPTACDTAGTASSRTATPVSAATSAAASPSDTRPVRSCAQARSVDLERWLAPH